MEKRKEARAKEKNERGPRTNGHLYRYADKEGVKVIERVLNDTERAEIAERERVYKEKEEERLSRLPPPIPSPVSLPANPTPTAHKAIQQRVNQSGNAANSGPGPHVVSRDSSLAVVKPGTMRSIEFVSRYSACIPLLWLLLLLKLHSYLDEFVDVRFFVIDHYFRSKDCTSVKTYHVTLIPNNSIRIL